MLMKEKMKVAEFVSRMEFGGVETILLNYALHFKNKEQLELHIITQDINDENCIRQFKENGFIVHVVTHKRKSILKHVKKIYEILRYEKFDVVHSHMTLTNFYVLFLAQFLGVSLRISHAHSAYSTSGIKKRFAYFILKKLNRISSNSWMACGYEAAYFLYGEKAIQEGKVHIVKNAVNLDSFRYSDEVREKIRKKYNMGNRLCVGHVGRFMAVKNHDFVLKIFKEILKLRNDAVLLLVGDGELRDHIHQYADELNIGDKIIFTGNIVNMNEVYQAMDVFLLPSFYEGLPVVSIEAQASGLPCLISDNVDHRCAITSCVKFMSIDKPASQWAEVICGFSNKNRSFSDQYIKELKTEGYDIDVEAHKLENVYTAGRF